MLYRLGAVLNAASIGVIGGADGPTAIFVASSGGALSDALTLAWQGMTGIFVVMIAIALFVWLLSRLTGKK
ncbi:MAG: sodium ion-translocating decarboxylase subunit beta [Provencibacterium sp.]|jgi:Na+-transporting methylmalonyl-CoA/oxaloacetate decarboxylase beta subunit|nr:sodium ion-translocating decarboxylase subunit beta [Provencibacterium sp.]